MTPMMTMSRMIASMDDDVFDDGDLDDNVWDHECRVYWEPVGPKKREITRQIEYKYSNRR